MQTQTTTTSRFLCRGPGERLRRRESATPGKE
jgi:hypothetical protein